MKRVMTNKFKFSILTALILGSLFYTSCKKDEVLEDLTDFECSHIVESRGNRIIGYDILDLTENGDFGMNYEVASGQLKGEFIQLLQPWNAFEDSQAGVFDGYAMQLFETINDFALSEGTKLSLIITPIDIPGRFLPGYLGSKKFNDPVVVESFNNLIDRIFNSDNGIVDPDNVITLSIGNEIDHYNWSANNDQPSEYKEFLQAIKPKVNSYGIPLHFTGTLYGMSQSSDTWIDLANVVDKVSVTYYPINSDFTVKPPNVIYSDFNSFFSEFDDKPIFIQEIGYPSSATLNSSETKQAEFFCNFFNAWDMYKDRVSYVSILRLNDVSLASAEETAVNYGIPNNQKFIEYIRTLGIRTWENTGTKKEAYEVIAEELNRRDW